MKKLLLLVAVSLCAQETYTYNTTTEGKTVQTVWTVDTRGEMLDITGKNPETDTKIVMTKKDRFDSFKQVDKNGDGYDVEREGEKIIAKRLEGNKVSKQKEYTSDKFPWIQEFGFGLKEFIKSGEKQFKFVILDPKKLSMHNMIALRLDEEKIEIGGKEVDAVKVKITLQGFKSMFWKGYSWWDAKKNLMLRYQANSGPHTPVSTLDFVSETSTPEKKS